MEDVKLALILALVAQTALAVPMASAVPPTTCGLPGDYEQALCAYQRRDFANAERRFRTIVEREAQDAETIRSTYFLARTLMKTGHFDEAHALLIRIYSLDPAFYDTWNGDFLLGECRKALGK
jgi:TolA-binding protein